MGHPGSCLGIAWTAAVGLGLTKDWAGVSRFVRHGDVVSPERANSALYDEGYSAYRDLYRRLSAAPRGSLP